MWAYPKSTMFCKIRFEAHFIGMFSDFPNQILRPTAAAVEMNEFELGWGGCNRRRNLHFAKYSTARTLDTKMYRRDGHVSMSSDVFLGAFPPYLVRRPSFRPSNLLWCSLPFSLRQRCIRKLGANLLLLFTLLRPTSFHIQIQKCKDRIEYH